MFNFSTGDVAKLTMASPKFAGFQVLNQVVAGTHVLHDNRDDKYYHCHDFSLPYNQKF